MENGTPHESPRGIQLFLGGEDLQCLLKRVREFLGVIAEDDDPSLARRLSLREGQVVLVVLGNPHVDEVGEVAPLIVI